MVVEFAGGLRSSELAVGRIACFDALRADNFSAGGTVDAVARFDFAALDEALRRLDADAGDAEEAAVRRRLSGSPRFGIVSFTVNPRNDDGEGTCGGQGLP